MGVESKDSGSGFKITNSGFITHSAPLEHVGDFELVFLLTCRSSGARTNFSFRHLFRITMLTG